jgi:gamma-glutamylputrescine oxidase
MTTRVIADIAERAPQREALPTEVGTFWLPGAPHDVAPALDADRRCAVAIVGGGFSGLSAAYHLKRLQPQLNIDLYEAGAIGFGTSGLNTGQCTPRVGPPIERQVRSMGEEAAAACYRYSLAAMNQTVELIERERIDCDLQETGQWQVALTERQALLLDRRAQIYRRLGFDADLISGAALRRELPGSPTILAALSFPAFALNPGSLCLGLKRVVQRAGVSVFERSAVTNIEICATPRLRVNGHAVRADCVIIATNGFASALGILRRCVFPVRVFAMATRPLRRDERRAIGWSGGQGLYDARHVFNFLRLTPQGQVVIGGEFAHTQPNVGVDVAPSDGRSKRLAAGLAYYFPALRDIEFEARWSGVVGCTLDGWPIIAPLGDDDNVYYVGAWNGHGVALATTSGSVVADVLTRAPAEQRVALPWLRRRAPGLPAAWLAPWALAGHMASLRLYDAWDGLFAHGR